MSVNFNKHDFSFTFCKIHIHPSFHLLSYLLYSQWYCGGLLEPISYRAMAEIYTLNRSSVHHSGEFHMCIIISIIISGSSISSNDSDSSSGNNSFHSSSNFTFLN